MLVSKNLKKLSLLTICSTAIISNANAATLDATAAIEILTPVAISETTGMDFAQVAKPAAGSGDSYTYTLSTGDLVSTSDGYVAGTDEKSGVYAITGSANNTVDVTISEGSATTGMAFTNFVYDIGAGDVDCAGATCNISSASLDGSGDLTLTLGASISVDENASTGTLNISLAADYN